MKILAIESSCDETAAAIISDNCHIISNVVVSQVDIFAAYGGVIPEVAARSHLEAILPVIHQALNDAHLTKDDIDYIAVTYAPGLLGSLLIGTLTARMLAILWQKPFYPVHHLKSHIYANWLHSSHSTPANPTFPLLSLVISGGHTQIIYMPSHNHFEIIGTTRDDAVGECFDKVAKILGLPYPGGPSIAQCALNGNPNQYHLPHPHLDGLDFSFSGLKTAVLRAVQADCHLPITTPSYKLASHLTPQQQSDFAASFQNTACDILLEKLQIALQSHPNVRSVVFAGGVSANQVLREKALHGLKNAPTRENSANYTEKSVSDHSLAQTSSPQPSESLKSPSAQSKTLELSSSQSEISKSTLPPSEPLKSHFGYSAASTASSPHSDNLIPASELSNSPKTIPSLPTPQIFFPEPKFTGDNAAMVGAAAYYEILSGVQPTDPYQLDILPRTPIH